MEFNFRSVDERPPSSALAAASSTQPNISPPDPIPNTRAMIERQLEKDRIKEEIIAAEILRRRIVEVEVRRELDSRRRVLEAEVRKELNLEREIAMRRAREGRSFEDPFNVGPFDPFNVNDGRFAFLASPTPAALNKTFSFPPRLTEAAVASDFNKILVAKPDVNLSGVKRKPEPTYSDSELPPFGLKKKPKEEWSCALCQVSATSEKVLNHHLNGKKHKAKEARLKPPPRRVKKFNAPLTKIQAKELLIWKRAKLSEPKEANDILTSPKSDAKETKKPLDHETNDGLGDRIQDTCPSKEKTEELSMQKVQCLEDLNNKQEIENNKNFKFWCERCKIGAFSPKVMLAHMSGKKHIFRAQELARNDAPLASFTTPLEAIKEAEDADAVKKTDEKISPEANTEVDEKIPAATSRESPGVDADLTKEGHQKIRTGTAVASSEL